MPRAAPGGSRGAAATTTSSTLAGVTIAFGGRFDGSMQLEALIRNNGGEVSLLVTRKTTHYIVANLSRDGTTKRAAKARELGLPVLRVEWLLDSITSGAMLATTQYENVVSATNSSAAPAPPLTTGKRKANDDSEEESDHAPSPSPKRPRRSARTPSTASTVSPSTAAAPLVSPTSPLRSPQPLGTAGTPPLTHFWPSSARSTGSVSPSATSSQRNQSVSPVKAASTTSAQRNQSVSPIKPPNLTTLVRKGAAPVDPHSPHQDTHHVYRCPESSEVYDCVLSYTDIAKNANKAYFMQLQAPDNGPAECLLYVRWGRVGERGQAQSKGPWPPAHAIRQFKSVFRSKTGLAWEMRRTNMPKPGKYTWLDMDRTGKADEDAFSDDGEPANAPCAGIGGVKAAASTSSRASSASPRKSRSASPRKELISRLAPPVQELARLIFDQSVFDATLAEMSYDVDKLPLGKIGKMTLDRGLQKLNDLSRAISDGEGTERLRELSSSYYTLIPHVFPRNQRPRTISSMMEVRHELDLLSSLSDMETSWKIMSTAQEGQDEQHPLDHQVSLLRLHKLEPLDRTSAEFQRIKLYAEQTDGGDQYMRTEVQDIFRIERADEEEQWQEMARGFAEKGVDNRRLLWHGSRTANWGSILRQGLKVAPPHAPVSGYMFGKGIYTADLASKSMQYTHSYLSGGHGLLLLCEVQLGKIRPVYASDYRADELAKQEGCDSLLGVGEVTPAGWEDAGKTLGSEALLGTRIPNTESIRRRCPEAAFLELARQALMMAANKAPPATAHATNAAISAIAATTKMAAAATAFSSAAMRLTTSTGKPAASSGRRRGGRPRRAAGARSATGATGSDSGATDEDKSHDESAGAAASGSEGEEPEEQGEDDEEGEDELGRDLDASKITLRSDEFVVWDERQVRFRYLVRVKG